MTRSGIGTGRGTAWAGAGLAVVLHGVLLLFLFLGDPPTAPVHRAPVKVTLAARPPRAEAPKPEAPKPPKPAPTPAPRPLQNPVVRRDVPPPKPVDAPPPAPVPAPAPAPRRSFAVSMDATAAGGGVVVPVTSGSADVSAPVAAADPRSDRGDATRTDAPSGTGSGAAPLVDVAAVSRLPELLNRPGEGDIRAAYPEEERRRGVEADVRLQILVTDAGRVRDVRVVRSAGSAFDAAATRLVKSFRFRPALQGDRVVSVWIPWTYRFRLGEQG